MRFCRTYRIWALRELPSGIHYMQEQKQLNFCTYETKNKMLATGAGCPNSLENFGQTVLKGAEETSALASYNLIQYVWAVNIPGLINYIPCVIIKGFNNENR